MANKSISSSCKSACAHNHGQDEINGWVGEALGQSSGQSWLVLATNDAFPRTRASTPPTATSSVSSASNLLSTPSAIEAPIGTSQWHQDMASMAVCINFYFDRCPLCPSLHFPPYESRPPFVHRLLTPQTDTESSIQARPAVSPSGKNFSVAT